MVSNWRWWTSSLKLHMPSIFEEAVHVLDEDDISFIAYLVDGASKEETRVGFAKNVLATLLFEIKLLLSGTLMIYL